MRDEDYRAVDLHREPAQHSDKPVDLPALDLVAAKEVCDRIENDEPRADSDDLPLDLAIVGGQPDRTTIV